MSPAQELYHQIAKSIPNAQEGKMFGALCFKAPNGKAVAMFWKDYMVFKLKGDAEKDARALDGVTLFTPMEGKSMNGWFQVPYDYKEYWLQFAKAAMEYVEKL